MKRFTATEKWDDPWFRSLPPALKCFWSYLCDRCDHAGVWQVDLPAASFFVGEKLDEVKVLKAFHERIEILPGTADQSLTLRWRVLKFVQFQYPNLSEDCKPHVPVFAAIQKHGLPLGKVKSGARVCSLETKAIETHSEGFQSLQEQDKDKETEQEPESSQSAASVIELSDAEKIYAFYPRKVGKKDALKAINRALKTIPFAALISRTEAYTEAVAKWPTEKHDFVPHPSTWFNRGSYDDDPETWKQNENNRTGSTRGFSGQPTYHGVTDK